jgi:hypothetical protein
MSKVVQRCLENAQNYQLRRWATNIARMNRTTLADLKIDQRSNQCLLEYILLNPEIIEQAID